MHRRHGMDTLLHRFGEEIKGVLEGFDRIVFKGVLKPLCFAAGMQMFLMRKSLLNKDYKAWATDASAAIVRDAEEYVGRERGAEIQYVASCNTRKEALAHEQQKRDGTESGLVGASGFVDYQAQLCQA